MNPGSLPARKLHDLGGFSLVEVIVALMILELGLLAVAGLMVTSARLMAEAARTERAVALAGTVGDSLLAAGATAGGGRSEHGLRIRWTPKAQGLLLRVFPEGAPGEVLIEATILQEPSGGE